MKKSNIRQIIRETIKEQFAGWENPVQDGQIVKKFVAPPLGANCYACVSNGLTGEYGIENILWTIPATTENFPMLSYGVASGWAGSELVNGDLFCGSYYITYNEMYPWETEYGSPFNNPNFPGPGSDGAQQSPWDLEPTHLFYTSMAAMEYWAGDRCSGTRPPRPAGPDEIPLKDKPKNRG